MSERRVSAATHKQALSALPCFYGEVTGVELPWLNKIGKPPVRHRLPVVLWTDEGARILCLLGGKQCQSAQLPFSFEVRGAAADCPTAAVPCAGRKRPLRPSNGPAPRTVARPLQPVG
jgi:hypothetical protein